MGIAPLVAGWKNRQPWPGSVVAGPVHGGQGPFAFPAAPLELHVELYLGGAWVDITSDVRYVGGGVRIVQDAVSPTAHVRNSRATMTLNNRDGKYSPRNPTGPYFGLLGRNTPIRIAVRADYRFHGVVWNWPQTWDKTGLDAWVPLDASGPWSRLSANNTRPLDSAIKRAMLLTTSTVPKLAYWSLEDAAGATRGASALPGGAPMLASGSSTGGAGVRFAMEAGRTQPHYTGFPILRIGTLALPSFGHGGSLIGNAAIGTSSPKSWTVQFIARTWAFDHGSDITMIRWATPGGSFVRYEVISRSGDGRVDLVAYNSAGSATVLLSTFPTLAPVDLFAYRITATQNGANVDTTYRVSRVVPAGEAGVAVSDSRAGTLAYTTTFTVNPNQTVIDEDPIVGSADVLNDLILGHLSVWDGIGPGMTAGGYTGPWTGWLGETAAARIARLCSEEGVAFSVIGDPTLSAPMGFQDADRLTSLLQDAAGADGGLLYDLRDAFGFGYRTRTSLYNQPTAVILSYSGSHHLAETPRAIEDDELTRNDVTATRVAGSSWRTEVTAGALSTSDPPDGVGPYPVELTVNVEADDQLPDLAGWEAHVGTWDAPRYEELTVGLHREVIATDPTLSARIAAVSFGDLIAIDDVDKAWLPPGRVSVLMLDYREHLDGFLRWIVWGGRPADPYTVAVLDDSYLDRVDTAGSELAVAIDESQTSFDVTTTSGPTWTALDAEDGFDIYVGGERMTVDNINGAQTFTVTRSVNGVVKSHAAGTEVRLWQAMILAR